MFQLAAGAASTLRPRFLEEWRVDAQPQSLQESALQQHLFHVPSWTLVLSVKREDDIQNKQCQNVNQLEIEVN